MRYLGFLILLWSLPFSSMATERVPAFPNLKTVDVPSRIFKIRVHYDPLITKLENKQLNEGGIKSVVVLTTRIDRTKSQRYEITYSDGPSADPAFYVSKAGTNEGVGGFAGIELFIPGNGSVYVSGHTNSLFDHRQKYVLKGMKLVEAQQPFFYVGLESVALREITIYSDKTLSTPVAVIPNGGKLSILVNEGDYFLIKTPFGLLGWTKYRPERLGEDFVKGLFFNGD